MQIQYLAEKKGTDLTIKVQIKGSKRIVYLDALKKYASPKDIELIKLLIQIQKQSTRDLDTLEFQRVRIPLKHLKLALTLLEKAEGVIGNLEEKEAEEVRLEPLLELQNYVGSEAKLFFKYNEHAIDYTDFAPSIAGIARERIREKAYEKELLDAGFSKGDLYNIPTQDAKEAIALLLECGWSVVDFSGDLIKNEVQIEEVGEHFAVSGSRALIDPKLQMQGVWEKGKLFIKREKSHALTKYLPKASWPEKLSSYYEALERKGFPQVSIDENFRGKLYPYQQKGLDWLMFLYRAGFSGLIADEMGLGKTVQVLAFLSRLRTNLPVLIVTPASLIYQWKREIDRFCPQLKAEVISFNQLRANAKQYSFRLFEVVVLDESSAIKTNTTQIARSCYALRSNFRICINGTPVENRPLELWSQFQFLLPNLVDSKSSIDTLRLNCAPFIMRRTKADVQLELPPKLEEMAWIEMDEEQKELYDQAFKEEQNPLEKILRLRQICLDPRLVGGDAKGAKLLRLIDEIEELRENHKILVFSQFSSFLKLAQEDIPHSLLFDGSLSPKEKERVLSRFETDDEMRVLFLSLKAGGVGLNLTQADYIFLLDPWWNEAAENQAIDRAHRIGQSNTVIARRFICPNTIEEKMLDLKSKKREIAEHLLDIELLLS